MTVHERTPVDDQEDKDKRAEMEDLPKAYRRMHALAGDSFANDITGVEALPISGIGTDQFRKNRRDLGYTHRKIAGELAKIEGATILPDDEPLVYGGT